MLYVLILEICNNEIHNFETPVFVNVMHNCLCFESCLDIVQMNELLNKI